MNGAPLHPLSAELARASAYANLRRSAPQRWQDLHATTFAPPSRMISEHPLVASLRLQQELDAHVAALLDFLRARADRWRDHPAFRHWPAAAGPDVISADLAIVRDDRAEGGWALRWVEFQAFTSLISSCYSLHLLGMDAWPALRGLRAWQAPPDGHSWLEAARRWATPIPGVLLETAPATQSTRFDLAAAAHWFQLPVIEPGALHVSGAEAWYAGASGIRQPVGHVFNRLVLHELGPAREAFEQRLGWADLSWHSHPAWYYAVNKALLPEMAMAGDLRAAPLCRWRELGVPAGQLVAKNIHSHGGHAVHLHVTAEQLDSLLPAADWIVQPRFTPYPLLLQAGDGAALFGEIRCVITLPAAGTPWVCMQMARLNRGGKASASALEELPGTGLALLYRPDGLK